MLITHLKALIHYNFQTNAMFFEADLCKDGDLKFSCSIVSVTTWSGQRDGERASLKFFEILFQGPTYSKLYPNRAKLFY